MTSLLQDRLSRLRRRPSVVAHPGPLSPLAGGTTLGFEPSLGGQAPGRRAEPPWAGVREPGASGWVAAAAEVEGVDPPDGATEDLKADLRKIRIERLRSLIDDVIQRQSLRLRSRAVRAEPRLPLEVCEPSEPPRWWREAADSADLPGHVEGTPDGALRVVRSEYPPGWRHGAHRVDGALKAAPDTLVQLALDRGLSQADARRALYLDTETTGLSRGAGTVPFLIGLAWFESETLVVEQLFLEELGQEEPMLRRLHERVAASSMVVSFNGKAYDWPLLVQRCVLHRLAPPPDRPHLDLLHCARRVYGRRLEQTRLCDLEDAVLGFRRERDVDGCEIPSLYWSFLRNRHPMPILGVLEHNLHDVVSMSTLLHLLCIRFETLEPSEDPQDQLERARLAARSKNWDRAEAFARAAVDGGPDPDTRHLACRLLADISRRTRRWEASEAWLLQALEVARSAPDKAEVHLALAKLYEHRLVRWSNARDHARAAEGAESSLAWTRRLDRIQAKLARRPAAARV